MSLPLSRSAAALLAKCRRAGVRVLLYQGRPYAGYPAGEDGVHGWRPAPPSLAAEIARHEDEIRALLGDTGSARPTAEVIAGGCLLHYAPFGLPLRHRHQPPEAA